VRHCKEGVEEANCCSWYDTEQSSTYMNCQQLAEGKRYQFSALLEQEMSVSNIAHALNYHRATIYRELKRNKKIILS
jgi:predicted transcriptional regulator